MGAQDLGPQPCSNILLACARLLPHVDIGDPAPLLHHLTGCLVELHGVSNEQHLSNALYALGRLHEQCGHTPLPEHLQGLAAGVLQLLLRPAETQTHSSCFGPQAVSITLWACAKLRYADPELLSCLAKAAGQIAGRMQEQQLSNSVWALGRLVEAGCLDGSSGVPGVQRLAEEAQRWVRERGGFTPQHLSNLLLGFAHLQYAAQPGTYRLNAAVETLAVESHMGRGFHNFNGQDLSNAAWALAKLGYGGRAWYAGCVEAALQPGFHTTAVGRAWSNLWWALAQARHLPSDAPLLLARTADAMDALHQKLEAQECSNTLWALATLGLYERRLVSYLLGRLVERLQLATPQHLSNALWAVAVIGPAALFAHVGEVGALLREVASRWKGDAGRIASTGEGLTQLWLAQLELAAHPAPEVRALAAILPGATRSGGISLGSAMERQARQAASIRSPASSRLRVPLATALQGMQQRQLGLPDAACMGSGSSSSSSSEAAHTGILSVTDGVLAGNTYRWVDFEVRLGTGSTVAVVVYGIGGQLANQPNMQDGGVQLFNRQLQRVYGEGNVVGVSVAEWEGLGGDVGRHEELLWALLLQGRGVELRKGEPQPGAGGPSQQQQQGVGRVDVALAPSAPPPVSQQLAPTHGSRVQSAPPVASSKKAPSQGKAKLLQRPRRVMAQTGGGDGRSKG